MPEPTSDTLHEKTEEKTPDTLSEEELDKVTGGVDIKIKVDPPKPQL